MPRPNRDRVSVTVYLARSGVDAIDTAAAESGQSRSDLLRESFRVGWPLVQAELRKAKK